MFRGLGLASSARTTLVVRGGGGFGVLSRRNRSLSSKVTIGDVEIALPQASTSSKLIPKGYLAKFGNVSSPEVIAHLRWIAQKYVIGQDMFLLSHPGHLTRNLVFAFAELCDLEVEHLVISKDTSEADLKQRREIVDGSVTFLDQPPVRAAINGRLLVLDGIEKAERNVLPTLNNLLENREMSLEDGRFLMREHIDDNGSHSNLVTVHPSFRVVALGSPVPPYPGRTLDPPLRSRFQGRFVDELSSETLLSCLHLNDIPRDSLQTVINFYEAIRSTREATIAGDSGTSISSIPSFSHSRLTHCFNILRENPGSVSAAVSRSFPLGCFLHDPSELGNKIFPSVVTCAQRIVPKGNKGPLKQDIPQVPGLTSLQSKVSATISEDLALGSSVCLFGEKGSGKSHIVTRTLASRSSKAPRIFPLYKELSARDFLAKRATSKDATTDLVATTWKDSPLIAAARYGGVCVLDGIDRVDSHCLLSLSRLLNDGWIDLPSGERLYAADDFRVVAIAAPPTKTKDSRERFISTDLGMSYVNLPAMNAKEIEQVATLEYGELDVRMKTALRALHKVSPSSPELKPSLRTSLRAFKLLNVIEAEKQSDVSDNDVLTVLENTFMIRFQSTQVISQFRSAMSKVGLVMTNNGLANTSREAIQIRSKDGMLTIGNVTVPQRVPKNIALVPNPVYYENATQSVALQDMLRAYAIQDDNPVLLIGNQGVGKNKLVDYLLLQLKAEREYVQLHRDTTIQSLTVLPRVEFGVISYEDTPLVRAARLGRVLVLDEADKASLEVVCLLKGLVGDGEVQLANGERLLSQKRIHAEHAVSLVKHETTVDEYISANNIVPIHPDFKLFVLANRPGIPFLGNNFFAELGDLFNVLVIENPDINSELQLLIASAPNANQNTLCALAEAFSELREHHEDGVLAYPFSAREAVAVAKHIESFPLYGMSEALENILGFDSLNLSTREFIANVFREHGFSVTTTPRTGQLIGPDGKPMTIKGGAGREAGMSKPRTDVGSPKHGKEDDQPHVGGNQWAGGTGGSDTAGLGGRGGPYRLDKGHPIHQVSDEDKAMVSEEGKRRAAAIAAEAFQKKLDEIEMGHGDYKAFKRYSEDILLQVGQIKDMLDEVLRRKKERIWLKNQNHGEFDDSKLVDGLTGEKLIFKRRGIEGSDFDDPMGDDDENRKKCIQFVVDVSGSMMRFNSLDGRLERMLKASLMVMEGLPRGKDREGSSLIEYSLAGHSGDTKSEVFVDFPAINEADDVDVVESTRNNGFFSHHYDNGKKIKNPRRGPLTEKDKMAVLETMIAHSQFCWSGDNTLGAIEKAVDRVAERGGLTGDQDERIVIVVSDANFRRYGIKARDLKRAMERDPSVTVHLILIASIKDEAKSMTNQLPTGRVHICFDNARLPTVIRKILTAD